MGAPSPLGIVLAGGHGRRLGGAKALVELRGRPLISYPLASLDAVLDEVVVVCKPQTELPALPGHEVWFESETPQHPLVGIRAALERAGDRAVLACALDLPLVTPGLVRRLATAAPAGAVLASHGGELQPLLGRYRPEALSMLELSKSAREAVGALSPQLVEVEDPLELFNVNTPADLERAAKLLRARG